MKWIALAVAASFGTAAVAARPLIGPWPIAHPTNLFVLGTPHLLGMKNLHREWLEPLLERLAVWKPEVITIEALSGPECRMLRDYARSWPDTANDYCGGVEKLAGIAGKATGLDMPAAEAAAEEAVAKIGPASPPGERRRMAALFAAAGNVGSAATQWLRLAPAERRAGDGVDAPLASALDRLPTLANENYWVAAALAARLGLERVYPTDDHLSDRIQAEAPPGLGDALTTAWSGPRPALVLQAKDREAGVSGGAGLLAYYRMMNRSDVGAAFVRADMGNAYALQSKGDHGRRYVGWWEARNLRMVANIRSALARRPGARALAIVGATHKPYFEAYLAMMHEVRLVPAAQVLGR